MHSRLIQLGLVLALTAPFLAMARSAVQLADSIQELVQPDVFEPGNNTDGDDASAFVTLRDTKLPVEGTGWTVADAWITAQSMEQGRSSHPPSPPRFGHRAPPPPVNRIAWLQTFLI